MDRICGVEGLSAMESQMYPTRPDCASARYNISWTRRYMTLGPYKVGSLWALERFFASVSGLASRISFSFRIAVVKCSKDTVWGSIGSCESQFCVDSGGRSSGFWCEELGVLVSHAFDRVGDRRVYVWVCVHPYVRGDRASRFEESF